MIEIMLDARRAIFEGYEKIALRAFFRWFSKTRFAAV